MTTSSMESINSINSACLEHGGQIREFYCEHHGQVICLTCCQIEHPNCDNITGVTRTVKRLTDLMVNQTKWASNLMDGRKTQIQKIQQRAKEFRENVKNLKTQIMETVTVLENKVIAEIDAIETKEFKDLENQVQKCEELIQKTTEATKFLKDLSSNEKSVQAPPPNPSQTVDSVWKDSRAYEKDLLKLSDELIDATFKFTPGEKIHSFFMDLKELGRLMLIHRPSKMDAPYTIMPSTSKTEKNSAEILNSLTNVLDIKEPVRAKFEMSFNARTSTDKYRCWLNGSAFIDDDNIVIGDYNNSKIKMFNKNGKLMTETSLPSVFDVAPGNGYEIAVSVRESNRVEFLSYISSNFSPNGKVDTRAFCPQGVAIKGDNCVVCCTEPPTIRVFNRSGKELKRITQKEVGPTFKNPSFVAFDQSGKKLYITTGSLNTVICVTISGKKCWEFTHPMLVNPRGIAVHGDNIIVAGKDSNNIVLLKTDGEFVRTLMRTNINFPHKLSLNQSGDRMVITQWGREYEMDDFVKVFSLTYA